MYVKIAETFLEDDESALAAASFGSWLVERPDTFVLSFQRARSLSLSLSLSIVSGRKRESSFSFGETCDEAPRSRGP